MLEKLEISLIAHAMVSHAMTRQGAISRNVANADTPGYRAVDVAPFSQSYEDAGGFKPFESRPGHFAGRRSEQMFEIIARRLPGNQSPNGNTVSLETEMMSAAEVRQEYDTALAIAKATSGILRSSLGRR